MPCPYHDDGVESNGERNDDGTEAESPGNERRGIDRRSFMQSALVIGGTSALGSVTGLFGMPDPVAAGSDVPSYGERLNRQHAWDDYERYAPDREQTLPPSHHLLLHVDYTKGDEPRPGDRKRADRAFRRLEEAFGWNHEGILFTVGYSPAYFDRFRDDGEVVMPSGLDPEMDGGLDDKQGLVRPGPLTDAISLDREDPAVDRYDACIHLASDNVQNLLAAEAVLWGERESVNGVSFEDATLEGVFTRPTEYPERRTGFVGHENLETSPFPERETGEEREDGVYPDDIPEDAELSMGFNDLYRNSVPEETNATILEDQKLVEPKPPGVFAQGTIQHVSKLDIDLETWYGQNDLQERREQMFTPDHDDANTGEVGERLGNSNAPGDEPVRDLSADGKDIAERTVDDATTDGENPGTVGHVQKIARARFDLESRITEEGIDTYRSIDRYDAATEREDDLPGHDGNQEAEQVVLRRDFDTTDQREPGNHFVALMRFNPYMVYVRGAMNGTEFDSADFGLTGEDRIQHEDITEEVGGEGSGSNNGIVPFLTTERRGNYLVPPLTLRALPPASAEPIDLSVTESGDTYRVTIEGVEPGRIDPDTARFGHYLDVNRARGTSPVDSSKAGGALTLVFEKEDTNLDPGEGQRARLHAERTDDRVPLRGTVEPFDPAPAEGGDGTEDESKDENNGTGEGSGNGRDE